MSTTQTGSGLCEFTKEAIIASIQFANEVHGLQPDDDPKRYVGRFLMEAIKCGAADVASELLHNRDEAERIVAGCLGMM